MTRKMTQGLFAIAAALLTVSMAQPTQALDETTVPPVNDSIAETTATETAVAEEAEVDSSEAEIASWPEDFEDASSFGGPQAAEPKTPDGGCCLGPIGGCSAQAGGCDPPYYRVPCSQCPA